jgi:hypothetical protein
MASIKLGIFFQLYHILIKHSLKVLFHQFRRQGWE